MVLMFGEYRARTTKTGWLLQRRTGKQWKRTEYFESVHSLISALQHRRLHEQTSGVCHDLHDPVAVVQVLQAVEVAQNKLRNEILGVSDGS
jgi:hypothetical protein